MGKMDQGLTVARVSSSPKPRALVNSGSSTTREGGQWGMGWSGGKEGEDS